GPAGGGRGPRAACPPRAGVDGPAGHPAGHYLDGGLTREDVSIVNRQRGAGTRILLDYELEQRGIDPAAIQGYGREEYTHLAVAAAVASGTACTGMGVRAAARALELDVATNGWDRFAQNIPIYQ